MHRLSLTKTGHAHSLGIELEQQRLTHRAARIRRTLSAMRSIAESRPDVPAPLRLGMNDFGRELVRVEQRLRELETSRAA
jgi:hypothetical protein